MKSFLAFLSLFVSLFAGAQELQFRTVTGGLQVPWEIIWGPDNHIWVTERIGKVSRVNPETGAIQTILTIQEVFEGVERGLMGMALHPDFTKNPYVFLGYTYGTNNTTVKVVRYQFVNNALTNPTIIIDNITGNSTHDGCRLLIVGNYLYITTGDAQHQELPQNPGSLNGKILRLNLNGTIPADNPIPNNPMWSLGHRNPQGLVNVSGLLYSSEHGPDSDDEVNLIARGANYGWPNVKGMCDTPDEITFCNQNNVMEPLKNWTPTLAVAGIDYYNNKLIPELNQSLLMVSLKAGQMLQLKLSINGQSITEQKVIINKNFGRLRDLCVSPDGRIFVATSNRDGRGTPGVDDDRIIEIKPEGSGISKAALESAVVFQNPVDASKPLHLGLPVEGDYQVMIFDVKGKQIRKVDVEGASTCLLPMGGLTKGVYFLKVVYQNTQVVKRMIVQ